ncbi:unnamed protein product, partial [Prorocentrum cordatum]
VHVSPVKPSRAEAQVDHRSRSFEAARQRSGSLELARNLSPLPGIAASFPGSISSAHGSCRLDSAATLALPFKGNGRAASEIALVTLSAAVLLKGLAPSSSRRSLSERRAARRRGREILRGPDGLWFVFGVRGGPFASEYSGAEGVRFEDGQHWLFGAVLGHWELIPLRDSGRFPGELDQLIVRRSLAALRGVRRHSVNASLVLAWLDASCTLRSLRHAAKGAIAWSRLFSESGRFDRIELKRSLRLIRYETLRAARVRADWTAMRLTRQLFLTMNWNEVDIYLYVDSSPQGRGWEMQAASYRVRVAGREFLSRMFAPVLLMRTQLSALAKTAALLWQIHLVFGGNATVMRKVLDRVRGVVSDMGTEYMVAKMNDCLPDFYQCLGAKFVLARRQLLLPRAIVIPGWRHKVDNLTRCGCNTLVWFPRFLVRIKALASLFRDEAINCTRSGCVLGFAFEHDLSKLRAGLNEANAWMEGRFGPDQQLLRQAVAMTVQGRVQVDILTAC